LRAARPFKNIVKESCDYASNDVEKLKHSMIDGSVVSYFSDHFTRQLMAGIMAVDYLGLCPKPNKRIEGGGGPGGPLFPGGMGSDRLGTDERLRGVRLRDDVPRPDVEGERVHRAGVRRQLRLPDRRLLLPGLSDVREP